MVSKLVSNSVVVKRLVVGIVVKSKVVVDVVVLVVLVVVVVVVVAVLVVVVGQLHSGGHSRFSQSQTIGGTALAVVVVTIIVLGIDVVVISSVVGVQAESLSPQSVEYLAVVVVVVQLYMSWYGSGFVAATVQLYGAVW